MNLVIVESPAKAKTIKKYLGKDFEVLASYGHVRDLVPKEGAVDPASDFAMKYQVIDRNDKHVKAITTKLNTQYWPAAAPAASTTSAVALPDGTSRVTSAA